MRTFPHLHRAPARGWINDPNGLGLVDGRFHVFYQFNPAAPVHDAIAWGHVSSTDLLRWTEHPIALTPQPDGPDRDGCWSGCLVDDGGTPTAVYTAIRGGPAHGVVALATSDRSLVEWDQEPEPIVETPRAASISETRDPFVFVHNGHRYAVQGCGHTAPGSTPSLMLWACDDLRDWTELGPLLTGDDPVAATVAEADIWECPGLVRVGDTWVLVISLWRSVHGTFALSGVRWLIGDLEDVAGGGLRFVAATGGVLDDGPAFYAPQLLALPDRVLLWGWSWELGRTPEQVEADGWAGTLTSPRELVVGVDRVVTRPAAELTGWRRRPLSDTRAIAEAAYEVVSDTPIALGLQLDGRCTPVVDADFFAGGPSRILVDGSLVEAFSATGSFTTRAYPGPGSTWVVDGPGSGWVLGLADD